jgi:DNA repair exonuclease SbcCD nuclease subunit
MLPAVRMLHTSDVHISGDEASIESLHLVVGTAIESNVDIVLIAGDLFDSARVPEEAVEQTISELGRLGRPVVVIPGNHDCIDEGSIYHRANLSTAGDHVYFAGNPDGEEFVFEHLSLRIWARGIKSHDPQNRPLAGYVAPDAECWNVLVTHGHYVPRGEISDRSSQITQDEIGRLQCHYLALGHWHRFFDVSEGTVKAFYSGSPSEPGRDAASVNLVHLSPGIGTVVERRTIGLPR